ncbi:MAG: SH3 domain-containing C40 family peptidase, partial [Melioribacteraceae bacterium]|nr:SH3 domain-containing C40 family peptidase [Melioribacteraceae bacterium]
IKTLPTEKLKGKTLGLIDVSVANLRTKPKHSAELVTQAILGTPVKVFKKKDGFYLIQTPDKYIAWVDDDGVKTISKDEYDNWYNSDKIIYTKEYGFSYSEANEDSERISDLVIGNILLKIGSEGEFIKVKYPDGRIAFILKTEVQDLNTWLSKAYPKPENIIATAKLFMGNPYLWGGTSAKGLDCSGFTKTVYYLNGVLLDRDASQQVKKGNLVDTENNFDELKKGDLLFFGFKAKDGKKERITHVGIYIDNLEFIHEAGKVKYNSFDKKAHNFSAYRLKNFIRAKRVISSVSENGIELIKNNEFYNGELK